MAEAAYRFSEIEPKWQRQWEDAGLFHSEPVEDLPNCVVIELPPFANGSLHLGHVRNYAMGDVYARFRRMAGFNVLYTGGFDSFGLPNELAAQDLHRHPKAVAEEVMAEMRRDFVRLGLSHDTRRIIGNHDEGFYGWVQWVFLKLFEQGLAYRQRYPVLWCPSCELTLADSLALGGTCWRCGTTVEARSLEQWLVREAIFADDMLASLDRLKRWPSQIKRIHADWIGRREGADVRFAVRRCPEVVITAFVSEPARVPDIAAIHLAPEHPAVAAFDAAGLLSADVRDAIGRVSRNARADAQGLVALGVEAAHPLTGADIAIAVSAALDVRTHDGVAVSFADSPAQSESASVIQDLKARDAGGPAVRYRLRDWNIARQRYWGPPIPIIHCPRCGAVAVPERELPVLLPLDIALDGHGNPLDRHPTFAPVACPRCAGSARRDTDTLETYCSPWWYHWNAKHMATQDPFDKAEARLYMPVDVMIGGEDQARTCFFHLRMMARALKRAGVVELDEPIDTLIAIGMVKAGGRKMSKSEGNAVDPKDIIARYGADALRFAILAAAAPESDFNWSEDGVRRASSFLNRVFKWCAGIASEVRVDSMGTHVSIDADYSLTRKLARQLATAVARTTESMCQNMFHLAASNLEMLFERIQGYEEEALKRRKALDARDRTAIGVAFSAFLRMLTPLCPHIAEECWSMLGGTGMIAQAPWPQEFPERFRKRTP
ncbi:MAG: class I tRNA ligase family protein [Acidobacteriia bacterium]|nr:class I tRNA ligase family protein [Terriglobia bacterium]